jgi:hypothetical protein
MHLLVVSQAVELLSSSRVVTNYRVLKNIRKLETEKLSDIC